jgi:hypothetical protein
MKSGSTSRMPGKTVSALSRSRNVKSTPHLPKSGSLPPNKRLRGLSPDKPKANKPQ